MRVLLKFTIPVEANNLNAISGSLAADLQSILAEQKPEAAYFFAQDGKRGGIVILDLKDTAEIPAIAEPYFLAFNASVEISPVMNAEDFARAIPGIEAAVKKYSSKTRAASA